MTRNQIKDTSTEMLAVYLIGLINCSNHLVAVEFFDMLSELLVRDVKHYEELQDTLHRDSAYILANLFTVTNLRAHERWLVDEAIILYTNCQTVKDRLIEWLEEVAEAQA